ncbi:MAG TPA: hypothetical protein VF272_03705 [Candidatus Saccharimonadia bacterium]
MSARPAVTCGINWAVNGDRLIIFGVEALQGIPCKLREMANRSGICSVLDELNAHIEKIIAGRQWAEIRCIAIRPELAGLMWAEGSLVLSDLVDSTEFELNNKVGEVIRFTLEKLNAPHVLLVFPAPSPGCENGLVPFCLDSDDCFVG